MIIAFTGAGISKESGIDTFQDRPGIREKLTRSYANRHPEKFREVMQEFIDTMKGKEPNDAHISLAEYDIPVITMNVDPLHELAGTKYLIKVHGRLPSQDEIPYCEKLVNCPVLYGDPAPMYQGAYNWVDKMYLDDIFLVIGASTYTRFSSDVRRMALMYGADVFEIQNNASVEVRKFLENHKDKIGDFDKFINRVII